MKARFAPLHLLLFTLGALACGSGDDAAAETAEEPPIVTVMNLPISLRSDAPAPTDALRVEISQSELHLDAHSLMTLGSSGRLEAAQYDAEGIPQLRQAIAAAPARARASLSIHAMVWYGTTVRVIQTLLAAGYRDIYVRVRQVPRGSAATTEGWMLLSTPRVLPPGTTAVDPAVFGGGNRPWADFGPHWRPAYDACRGGHYVDCDFPQTEAPLAEGGFLQLVLWTRGRGMQVRFRRVGEAVEAAPTGGPALIEGARAAPAGRPGEEVPPDPVTTAAFAFRADEATRPESAIPEVVRPVCGPSVCQTIVEADDETPTMRVISLLGAAFPNAGTPPDLALRLPG